MKTKQPRTTTDYHFRLSPKLRARLDDARELVTVKGDRNRKDSRAKYSELVRAFVELGLDMVESGASIVHAPSLARKVAHQKRPGEKVHAYVSPMLSADLYSALCDQGRVPTLGETELLDSDARAIEPGQEVAVRGTHFTDAAMIQTLQDAHGPRPVGRVQSVHRKRATVKLKGSSVALHVFDLEPA